jgi:hypothetical protein
MASSYVCLITCLSVCVTCRGGCGISCRWRLQRRRTPCLQCLTLKDMRHDGWPVSPRRTLPAYVSLFFILAVVDVAEACVFALVRICHCVPEAVSLYGGADAMDEWVGGGTVPGHGSGAATRGLADASSADRQCARHRLSNKKKETEAGSERGIASVCIPTSAHTYSPRTHGSLYARSHADKPKYVAAVASRSRQRACARSVCYQKPPRAGCRRHAIL